MMDLSIKTQLKVTKVEVDLEMSKVEVEGQIVLNGRIIQHNPNNYKFKIPLEPKLLEYVIENIEKYMGETIMRDSESK